MLFTYGLVLLRYYGVAAEKLGLYLVPLAPGNFMGPLTIGRLFDTMGRKKMISLIYISSGVLLAITAWLFKMGVLTSTPSNLLERDFLCGLVCRERCLLDGKRDFPS